MAQPTSADDRVARFSPASLHPVNPPTSSKQAKKRNRMGDDGQSNHNKVVLMKDQFGQPLAAPLPFVPIHVSNSDSTDAPLPPPQPSPGVGQTFTTPSFGGKIRFSNDTAVTKHFKTNRPSKQTMFVDSMKSFIFVKRMQSRSLQRNYPTDENTGLQLWRKIHLPAELWLTIFSFMPLKPLLLLLKQMRSSGHLGVVDSRLNLDSVLKDAAHVTFGEHQPPEAPDGVSKVQWYELIVLPGCTTCSDKSNRSFKLVPAFMERMCPDCRDNMICDFTKLRTMALNACPSLSTAQISQLASVTKSAYKHATSISHDVDLNGEAHRPPEFRYYLTSHAEAQIARLVDIWNNAVQVSASEGDGLDNESYSDGDDDGGFSSASDECYDDELENVPDNNTENDLGTDNDPDSFIAAEAQKMRLFRMKALQLGRWDTEWQRKKQEQWKKKREALIEKAKLMTNPLPEYLVLESNTYAEMTKYSNANESVPWDQVLRRLERERQKLLQINIWDPAFPRWKMLSVDDFEQQMPDPADRSRVLSGHLKLWHKFYPEDDNITALLHMHGFTVVPPLKGMSTAANLYKLLAEDAVYADPAIDWINDLALKDRGHWWAILSDKLRRVLITYHENQLKTDESTFIPRPGTLAELLGEGMMIEDDWSSILGDYE